MYQFQKIIYSIGIIKRAVFIQTLLIYYLLGTRITLCDSQVVQFFFLGVSNIHVFALGNKLILHLGFHLIKKVVLHWFGDQTWSMSETWMFAGRFQWFSPKLRKLSMSTTFFHLRHTLN